MRRDKKKSKSKSRTSRMARARGPGRAFRSRRAEKSPGAEGRWSLLVTPGTESPSGTEKQASLAAQLIERYGVLTREMVAAEGVVGSFSGLYPVLKAMEEAGKIRRGYFVAGLGAAQFAAPGAEDRLRDMDRPILPETAEDWSDEEEASDDGLLILAATDPANPYGSALKWPETKGGARPQRVAGAKVLMRHGQLLGYIGRTGATLMTFLPEADPDRTHASGWLMDCFRKLSGEGEVVYLTKVDGQTPRESGIHDELVEAGFVPSMKGYLLRAT